MDNETERQWGLTGNPVIMAIIAALRLLGCVTRDNAKQLLQQTSAHWDLSTRERDWVLDTFPDTCPGTHLAPQCGPHCTGRLLPHRHEAAVRLDRSWQALIVGFRVLGFDASWLEYPLNISDSGIRCNDETCGCGRTGIVGTGHQLAPRDIVMRVAKHRELHTSTGRDLINIDIMPQQEDGKCSGCGVRVGLGLEHVDGCPQSPFARQVRAEDDARRMFGSG